MGRRVVKILEWQTSKYTEYSNSKCRRRKHEHPIRVSIKLDLVTLFEDTRYAFRGDVIKAE